MSVSTDTQTEKSRNGSNTYSISEHGAVKGRDLPIDHGWAWVILFAVTTTQFILMGQIKGFGIIFVQLQKRFHSSSSKTAVIPLIQCAVYSICSLLVMTVGQKLSSRKSVLIGTVICALSSITTAFADDIYIAYVTLGIAIGISHSFILPQLFTTVSLYFQRHRGLANSINNSGASLGGLVLAPLITLLFEHYGFVGAFIIITGLNLNVFVTGALLRPLECYSRNEKNSKSSLLLHEIHSNQDSNSQERTCKQINHDEETCQLSMPINVDTGDNFKEDVSKSTMDSCVQNCKVFCFSAVSNCFNKKLLSKPTFRYFLLCNVFLGAGNTTASVFLPPYLIETGGTETQAAWIVSTVSIVDFFARFLFGWLCDKTWCTRTTILALSNGIIGISALFIHFMTSFSTLLIYAVIVGLFGGLYFSLFAVLLLDFFRMDEFKTAIGYTSFIQGASSGLSYILLGYIRDVSGSYVFSFDCNGIMLIIGSVMIYFLPRLHKRNKL